jgi:hypothetical protein
MMRAGEVRVTSVKCRLDRGAPQVAPQNIQGNAVSPSLGGTALFEDSLQLDAVFLRSATGSRQVRRRP